MSLLRLSQETRIRADLVLGSITCVSASYCDGGCTVSRPSDPIRSYLQPLKTLICCSRKFFDASFDFCLPLPFPICHFLDHRPSFFAFQELAFNGLS